MRHRRQRPLHRLMASQSSPGQQGCSGHLALADCRADHVPAALTDLPDIQAAPADTTILQAALADTPVLQAALADPPAFQAPLADSVERHAIIIVQISAVSEEAALGGGCSPQAEAG